MICLCVLAHVTLRKVVCKKFSHSRKVEPALDHTGGPVYTPVTCDNGVMVGRDNFLNAVFGTTILSSAQSRPYLKCWRLSSLSSRVNGLKIGEDVGVLTVIVHPIVENGVGWGNKASNDVIGRMGP